MEFLFRSPKDAILSAYHDLLRTYKGSFPPDIEECQVSEVSKVYDLGMGSELTVYVWKGGVIYYGISQYLEFEF
jgi:hypothetical protein